MHEETLNELLYIKQYYYVLIGVVAIILFILILSYDSFFKKNNISKALHIVVFFLAVFSIFYLGFRDFEIGIDTLNYLSGFNRYLTFEEFVIHKDPFFDFLLYAFSRIDSFQLLLLCCSAIYVYSAYKSLHILYESNFAIPFVFFVTYPFFFQFGINVMRSGMAASVFLLGIAYSYKENKIKEFLYYTIATLLHVSMIVPIAVYIINKKFKINILLLCFSCLVAISFVYVGINPLGGILVYFDRFSSYGQETNELQGGLILHVIAPIMYICYMIFYRKVNDKFYVSLVATYLIVLLLYVLFIKIPFALRVNYLSGCMLPFIYFYPIYVLKKFKHIKFLNLKLLMLLTILIFIKILKT